MFGVSSVNVADDCQPVVGAASVVVRANSGVCPVPDAKVAPIVMLFDVIAVGGLSDTTAAPSPLSTGPAETVPETGTAAPAPVTLAAATVVGTVMFATVALAAVGVPVMATVTTVLLVRVTVPEDSPAGRLDTAKLALVRLEEYVPLVRV